MEGCAWSGRAEKGTLGVVGEPQQSLGGKTSTLTLEEEWSPPVVILSLSQSLSYPFFSENDERAYSIIPVCPSIRECVCPSINSCPVYSFGMFRGILM